jgi:hypothetical protein
MIRIEGGASGRMRIIGSLEGPAVRVLLEAIAQGPLLLDLSEVDRADEAAVRLLAGLRPERCALAGCPHWLQLWIERLRGAAN